MSYNAHRDRFEMEQGEGIELAGDWTLVDFVHTDGGWELVAVGPIHDEQGSRHRVTGTGFHRKEAVSSLRFRIRHELFDDEPAVSV